MNMNTIQREREGKHSGGYEKRKKYKADELIDEIYQLIESEKLEDIEKACRLLCSAEMKNDRERIKLAEYDITGLLTGGFPEFFEKE